jgi:NAD(P)H-hydrate epimerase
VLEIITSEQMREVDRLTTERFAVPSILLMESAAGASAARIQRLFPEGIHQRAILVLCGPGNNGGDGAALARRLWLDGAHLRVVLFGRFETAKGDARTNFEILQGFCTSGTPENLNGGTLEVNRYTDGDSLDDLKKAIRSSDVIIDALFGTGLVRPLSGPYLEAVGALNEFRATRSGPEARTSIVSLDIPSGLNADLATPIGDAVRADLTVTFTRPKPANVLPPASDFSGILDVADIGSPRSLIAESGTKLFLVERSDAVAWLKRTRYLPGSYKNSHGQALVIAGSRNMTGAAVLSSDAAMVAGTGLVTLATPRSALPLAVARLMPEIMAYGLEETESGAIAAEALEFVTSLLDRMDAVAIGPGLSGDQSTRQFVKSFVENRTTPLVIDADGINALSPWPTDLKGSREKPLVLTPHPGEMARLVGGKDKLETSDRVAVAREFAQSNEVILVLKGQRTLVADPDGNVYFNPTGNAGLGTAGAGDTLTGIITGFLAQEVAGLGADASPLSAVLAALYIGGLAGDLAAESLGMRTMVASDIRRHLSVAVLALDPAGEQP